MRRLSPDTIPTFLRDGAPPPRIRPTPGRWTASFELKSITSILGGGVSSFEPDTVDVVRIPGIRGSLRWWWRALYDSGEAPDSLFAREAQLWGGVGIPGTAESEAKEGPGLRSRVRLAIEVLEPGQVVRAGVHRRDTDGNLKALPHWEIGRQLGYALFPLQRSKPARQDFDLHNPHQEMPTRWVRTDVRFRLNLTLAGLQPGRPPSSSDIVQVLASVWSWLYFGGLGARTRRGFGALEIVGPPILTPRSELDVEIWRRLFLGPVEFPILSWLQDFERVAAPRGAAWPFEILIGNRTQMPSMAHKEVVDFFRSFRQEPNIGRDPGPGQSRWPEPHLLRTLAPPGKPFPVAHRPPPALGEQISNGEVGAPRAAFGLPIQVQFKGDDKRASATILPVGAQRWPSPLLLRPLRTKGGYLPAVVLLPFLPPEEVEVEFEETKGIRNPCRVAAPGGARFMIKRFLERAGGRALEAFAAWLVDEKSYSRISPGRNRSGRDA